MHRMLRRALHVHVPLVLTLLGCSARQPALAPHLPAVPALITASPERVGMDANLNQRLDSITQHGLAEGAAPGAALAVGRYGRLVHQRAYGRIAAAADAPAVTDSTRYDMASLNKVVATTTAAMILEERGLLDIDRPVAGLFAPRLPRRKKAGIHRGGSFSAHNGWLSFPGAPRLGAEFPGPLGRFLNANERKGPLRLKARGKGTLYRELGIVSLTGVES